MSAVPEAIILGLAPFAPLFSDRVWLYAQVLLLGAILTSGPRTVTAALRVMGLARERYFTNYHRVLNRATWSARHGSRILLGVLITVLVPPGVTIVLGADDTVEHRSGRKITTKGYYSDAVRSSTSHVIRCFGLKWVSMMLLVPMPWARRVWALACLTVLCWPAEKAVGRRHKTSVDWVRQMMQQVRRWLPGRRLGRLLRLCLAVRKRACCSRQLAAVLTLQIGPGGGHLPRQHRSVGGFPTPAAGWPARRCRSSPAGANLHAMHYVGKKWFLSDQ